MLHLIMLILCLYGPEVRDITRVPGARQIGLFDLKGSLIEFSADYVGNNVVAQL